MPKPCVFLLHFSFLSFNLNTLCVQIKPFSMDIKKVIIFLYYTIMLLKFLIISHFFIIFSKFIKETAITVMATHLNAIL